MLESKYQAELIKEIERRIPDCLVLKNDSAYRQGIPDLLILSQDRWALLEVKTSATAEKQPNQEYYIEKGRKMSFAEFIYPANQDEVLDALQQSFGISR